MRKMDLNTGWMMRPLGDSGWVKARVPGSVYGDLLDAGLMDDPFWKDNEDRALSLMDSDYEYLLHFACREDFLMADDTILRFDGLDTIADIYLNDIHLGHAENMHRTWEFSVKALLTSEDNQLRVLLHSPTRFIKDAFAKAPTLGTEDAMNGFVHIRKAHYMFGWDWGAHLPDAGIFRQVTLIAVEKARLDCVQVLQFHEDDRVRLEIHPEIVRAGEIACGEIFGGINDASVAKSHDEIFRLKTTIKSPDGRIAEYGDARTIIIDPPALWWPNGYGPQNLYDIRVTLCDSSGKELDTWEKRIGLRTITMDRRADKWGERFATCVNGVNIFAMGADYIPEDHLLGRVTESRTRELLDKAVFANFNSIRVWGGGYYPDDCFYDLCDEMGLVVWQDFMFACAVYDLTEEFESNIRSEFADNLRRIRHHACLGLMCGNNEMESFVKEGNWVSKDSEVRDYIIMYEQILPMMMRRYAPQVFYWSSSPSSGGSFDAPQDPDRGDVHYWEVWHGNKPFSEYRKFYFRYLSEFGFQSFPSVRTVETFTDDERDKNIFSYIMEKHQRNGAANGKIMNYMQQIYRYPTDFDTLIYASQLLQADAIRYGVEHLRRNRNDDRCMGTIYWQFNDCWPVASWSSVDYAHRLKALHYAARRFFAPVMISCHEEGMMGSGQELVRLPFEFPKSICLCVTNETLIEQKLTVKWQLRDASATVKREESSDILVSPLYSLWLDRVDLPDLDIFSEYVSYQVLKDGEILSEGTVIFSYPKYFQYKDPGLLISAQGKYITVSANAYARYVEIRNENDDLILSDNYFDMNAGVKTVEIIRGKADALRVRCVYDI